MIHVPDKRLRSYDKVAPGEPTTTVQQTGPDGQPLTSVRSLGDGVHEVYGGDSAPLGRITRRSGRTLPWPRRVRWIVQPAQGEALTGQVGTRTAWTVFVLISPLYFLCWAVMAAQGSLWLLLGEKGEAKKEAAWEMEPPTWTRWCAADEPEPAMEYRTGRKYLLDATRLDHRLAYAQAVLHVWDRA
ncbi:hypothetical protein AQI84_22500 [Streptomyces griseorubiginosus]|nr:hypothetical protein AQI84_22500 [Streptomyces griseorubiginosus]